MKENRTKFVASIAVLLLGLAGTVAVVCFTSSSTVNYSEGVIIDFGDYDIDYVAMDGDLDLDSAFAYACGTLGYYYEEDDGAVVSVNGVSNYGDSSWGLYVVYSGDTEWTQIEFGSGTTISDYAAVCIGYCAEEDEPTPAVDSTGYFYYSYSSVSRIASLAPSCTETVCAVGGLDLLVGTDMYSNYPDEVVERQESGEIAIVGGYTNPSYEVVLKQDPDLVVCVSSQSGHLTIAEKLRSVGINVLVLDGGESIEAVLDNIYAMGVVLGAADMAVAEITSIQDSMSTVAEMISNYGFDSEKRVMIALSAVKSPWVSGGETYVADVMSMMYMINIYDGESGWVQVNAETIVKYDPEVILVVSSDYEATQSEYDTMLEDMTAEWKSTIAYKTGEIYLFAGAAADCVSRPGPRVAELAELLALAVYGEAFDVDLPKYVGDNYTDYLTISREEDD